MTGDCVEIKGNPKGITIILDASLNFEIAKQSIYDKLQKGRNFFAGSAADLKVKDGILSKEEYEEIRDLLGGFSMTLQDALTGGPLPMSTGKVLLLKRTLRSGQRISHRGTIVILGDVNAGSEIVATGDILVMGTLRGMAHAGARGDKLAVVAAFRLKPTQIRIANVISRPPEDKSGSTATIPEIAHLKGDLMIIEPLNTSANIIFNNPGDII